MKIQHFWQGLDSGAEDIFNKKGVLWPCQNVHQSIVSEMNQNFCSCMNVSWSNLLLVDKTVHIWSIYDTYHLHKSMKLEVLEATCYVIHLYHLIRKRRLYCFLCNSRGVVETRGGDRSGALYWGLAALDPVAMWWLGLTYELETTLVWSPSSCCDCPLAFYVFL